MKKSQKNGKSTKKIKKEINIKRSSSNKNKQKYQKNKLKTTTKKKKKMTIPIIKKMKNKKIMKVNMMEIIIKITKTNSSIKTKEIIKFNNKRSIIKLIIILKVKKIMYQQILMQTKMYNLIKIKIKKMLKLIKIKKSPLCRI